MAADEAPASEAVEQMRQIWEKATPDTISGDVRRARLLMEEVPPSEVDQAQVYFEAILRLEHWLHDL